MMNKLPVAGKRMRSVFVLCKHCGEEIECKVYATEATAFVNRGIVICPHCKIRGV